MSRAGDPIPPTREVASLVEADLERGDEARAFNRVISYVERVFEDPGTIGAAFGSPVLDDLCLRLGRRLGRSAPERFDPSLVAYVATRLVFPGGHTFVIRDLVEAQPGRRHLVLLTGVGGGTDLEEAQRFLGSAVAVEAAPDATAREAAAWVAGRLAGAAPGRAFLLAHPHDAAAVAGFQPGSAGEMLFYHHVDHRFTLGVHLAHARHLDFRYAGFANCRHDLGLAENLFLPLTAGEPSDPVAPPYPLTTASAGRWGKFAPGGEDSFAAQVPRWLAATGGRHLHFGGLPPAVVASIEKQLTVAGMPVDRFVNLPEVASLRAALVEEGVGLYLDSFPLGGCRSTVEAMAAGIPVAVYRHPSSKLLSNETLAYPGAFVWQEPEDLVAHLAALEPGRIEAESAAAIEHYAAHHHPRLLAAALAGESVAGRPVVERAHPIASLEGYLERAAAAPGDEALLGRLLLQALRIPDPGTRQARKQISRVLYALSRLPSGEGGGADRADLSGFLLRHWRSAAEARPAPETAGAAGRREAGRQAECDLRRLLRRLGWGPVGWLLRRFKGFRALEERYLKGTERGEPSGPGV
ncbi:MAG: hypothetical protein FJW79_05635 [Actinobacteria bacterium]|nr:hypothetical protein [Actinomycetota bacterium]